MTRKLAAVFAALSFLFTASCFDSATFQPVTATAQNVGVALEELGSAGAARLYVQDSNTGREEILYLYSFRYNQVSNGFDTFYIMSDNPRSREALDDYMTKDSSEESSSSDISFVRVDDGNYVGRVRSFDNGTMAYSSLIFLHVDGDRFYIMNTAPDGVSLDEMLSNRIAGSVESSNPFAGLVEAPDGEGNDPAFRNLSNDEVGELSRLLASDPERFAGQPSRFELYDTANPD